jgi:hypothetical protein
MIFAVWAHDIYISDAAIHFHGVTEYAFHGLFQRSPRNTSKPFYTLDDGTKIFRLRAKKITISSILFRPV